MSAKFTPTSLPERTEKTSRPGLFYIVPFHPKNEVFNAIPKEFLQERLNHSIESLKDVVKVSMSKGLTVFKDSTEVEINELHDRIMDIINSLPSSGVTNNAQLGVVCTKVRKAVDGFKSTTNKLHFSEKIAEIFFQIERRVVSTLFVLPGKAKEITELGEPTGQIVKRKELSEVIQKMELIVSLRKQLENMLQVLKYSKNDLYETMQILNNISLDPPTILTQQEAVRYKNALVMLAKYLLKCNELLEFAEAYSTHPEYLQLAADFPLSLISVDLGEGGSSQVIDNTLQRNFIVAMEAMKLAVVTTTKLREPVRALYNSSKVRALLIPVLYLVPNGTDELIKSCFEEEKTLSVQSAPVKESLPISLDNLPVQAVTCIDTNPTNDNFLTPKTASIEGLTPREVAQEVRARLIESPDMPLLKYLFERKKWNYLRSVLERLSIQRLRDCRLMVDVVGGSKSYYKTGIDLYVACFPQAYGRAGNLPLFNSNKLSPKKPFQWNRMDITEEDLVAEVKRRLFQGWPLIRDLVEEQQWASLRQLFNLVTAHDILATCGIGSNCVGGPKAWYKTKEEMYAHVFPEVYSEEK